MSRIRIPGIFRITRIKEKIVSNPFLGKSLKGDFQGCYRYRFGDYRVIYTILKQEVLILRIGRRKEIYR
jgi:mRNA interferase RelE/StbE